MRDAMLIIHFLGLAMGVGTGLAYMFLGIASSKLDQQERTRFTINTFPLSRMGHIGLALLIISGGALMTPYWGSLASTPLLIAKLVLVLVLAALIGIIGANMKRAKQGNPETHLAKLPTLGRISILTGLAIIILAVLVFH